MTPEEIALSAIEALLTYPVYPDIVAYVLEPLFR